MQSERIVEHTPGPWMVYERKDDYPRHIAATFIHAGPDDRDDTGYNVVARAYTTHAYDGVVECQANARPIAAAPEYHEIAADLIEMEAAVEHLPEPMCERLLTLIDRAKTIRAKATGESSHV